MIGIKCQRGLYPRRSTSSLTGAMCLTNRSNDHATSLDEVTRRWTVGKSGFDQRPRGRASLNF
jgi:hypothetical protein